MYYTACSLVSVLKLCHEGIPPLTLRKAPSDGQLADYSWDPCGGESWTDQSPEESTVGIVVRYFAALLGLSHSRTLFNTASGFQDYAMK